MFLVRKVMGNKEGGDHAGIQIKKDTTESMETSDNEQGSPVDNEMPSIAQREEPEGKEEKDLTNVNMKMDVSVNDKPDLRSHSPDSQGFVSPIVSPADSPRAHVDEVATEAMDASGDFSPKPNVHEAAGMVTPDTFSPRMSDTDKSLSPSPRQGRPVSIPEVIVEESHTGDTPEKTPDISPRESSYKTNTERKPYHKDDPVSHEEVQNIIKATGGDLLKVVEQLLESELPKRAKELMKEEEQECSDSSDDEDENAEKNQVNGIASDASMSSASSTSQHSCIRADAAEFIPKGRFLNYSFQAPNGVPGLVVDDNNNVLGKKPSLTSMGSKTSLEGVRVYTRQFLMTLQFTEASMKRPRGLPGRNDELPIVLDEPHNYGVPFVLPKPLFALNLGDAAATMPGEVDPAVLRAARMQKKGRKKSKMTMDGGWGIQVNDPISQQTDELYKKVHTILNKLNPQTFKTLVEVLVLTIDSEEKLSRVIDLVFEKATNEPDFCSSYAELCQSLMQVKVPNSKSVQETQNIRFRKLLLNRCQKEFEQDRLDEVNREAMLQALGSAASEKKLLKLRKELEDFDNKVKKRWLGNLRFMSHLFALHILTEPLVHEYLGKILKSQKDEETIDVLCHVITMIGRQLDESPVGKKRLDQYIQQMQKIADARKMPAEVIQKIKTLIDKRAAKWPAPPKEETPLEKLLKEVRQERQKTRNVPRLSSYGGIEINGTTYYISPAENAEVDVCGDGDQTFVDDNITIELNGGAGYSETTDDWTAFHNSNTWKNQWKENPPWEVDTGVPKDWWKKNCSKQNNQTSPRSTDACINNPGSSGHSSTHSSPLASARTVEELEREWIEGAPDQLKQAMQEHKPAKILSCVEAVATP